MWECRGKHAHAQFSVRSGTFMEDSRLALEKWLMALWLMAERNLTISSYDLARRIGVTREELAEAVAQLTFYTGLPVVHEGLAMVERAYEDEPLR